MRRGDRPLGGIVRHRTFREDDSNIEFRAPERCGTMPR
jgi:hypothetical protein